MKPDLVIFGLSRGLLQVVDDEAVVSDRLLDAFVAPKKRGLKDIHRILRLRITRSRTSPRRRGD
jgi:hypothetical protein